MNKRFVLILVGVAVVLGGLFWLTRDEASAPQSQTQPSSHTYGEGAKAVTLVEYGDFQCPACGAYFPVIKQLKEEYKADITFQFRHFPLVQIHPNAMAAHRAAEAAAMQDKFWEMHDLLYENQQSWSTASNPARIFEDYAVNLSLNVEKFRQDVASITVNDIINADLKAGQALGADSTPTFVLDGKKLEEIPRDYEGFKKLIDDTIAAKSTGNN